MTSCTKTNYFHRNTSFDTQRVVKIDRVVRIDLLVIQKVSPSSGVYVSLPNGVYDSLLGKH